MSFNQDRAEDITHEQETQEVFDIPSPLKKAKMNFKSRLQNMERKESKEEVESYRES